MTINRRRKLVPETKWQFFVEIDSARTHTFKSVADLLQEVVKDLRAEVPSAAIVLETTWRFQLRKPRVVGRYGVRAK